MHATLTHTDQFLRGTGPFAPQRKFDFPLWWLPAIILFFAPIYGAMMGSFNLVSPERLLQVVYSGVKAPLLLLATTLLCLPGFFVLNTILGLRDDFREALHAILAGQAGLSIALASFAPMVRFWYFSTDSYRGALLFNAFIFTLAAIAAQMVIFRYYRVLIRRHRYHLIMLFAWFALYAFVGIQMGWTLRPFVGSPSLHVSFFRAEPFTNAYVVVFNLIFG
ncbi:MAG: hypothetical protein ACYTF1_18205 [Planctomycetota bacterium]|jgi:hypothetical protein